MYQECGFKAKGGLLWPFVVLLLGLTSCSKPIPTGTVPPLNVSPDQAVATLDQMKAFSFFKESELAFEEKKNVPSASQAEVIDRFKEVYSDKNRPRIAVFFNYKEKHKKGGLDSAKRIVFEEGFLKTCLAAGAILVDREMIIKITEVERGINQSTAPSPKVVMDALKDKADILIEIVSVEDYGFPGGYIFKAASRTVSDGRILAVASSVRQPEDEDEGPPKLETVASIIALDLMSGMTSSWTD